MSHILPTKTPPCDHLLQARSQNNTYFIDLIMKGFRYEKHGQRLVIVPDTSAPIFIEAIQQKETAGAKLADGVQLEEAVVKAGSLAALE